MPVILSTDLQSSPATGHREGLLRFVCLLDGLPPLCEYARDSPPSPHYSWRFVAKSRSRQARQARGAAREEGILETVCWPTERRARLPGRRANRVQVRRHRACEIERPLHDRGAKKDFYNGFWLPFPPLQQKRSWMMRA